MYTLHGLSFREYLDITDTAHLPVIPLQDILSGHMQLASSIAHDIKPLPHFEQYLKTGYYPFFIETSSPESYYERLQKVVSTIIENDIPAVENIEYETLQKAKRLLMILAQSAPFTPNIANMCANISTTRNQLIHLLSLLERAALIRQLHAQGKGLKAPIKREQSEACFDFAEREVARPKVKKGFSQIADLPDSYVVADNIETGYGNKIPLWLFGFIY